MNTMIISSLLLPLIAGQNFTHNITDPNPFNITGNYTFHHKRCSYDITLDGSSLSIRTHEDFTPQNCSVACNEHPECFSFEVYHDHKARNGTQMYGEEIRKEGFCELSREFEDQYKHLCDDSLRCDGGNINTNLFVRTGENPGQRYNKTEKQCVTDEYKIRETFVTSVDHCAQACDSSRNCNSFTFYKNYYGQGWQDSPPATKVTGLSYCALHTKCDVKSEVCDGAMWNTDAYSLIDQSSCYVEVKYEGDENNYSPGPPLLPTLVTLLSTF